MRNMLIHGYDRTNADYLVETTRDDLPPLIVELERILSESADEGTPKT